MYPMMNQMMGGGHASFAPGQNQVRQAIPVPQQGNQGMANMGAYGGQMPGGSAPYQQQQQRQQYQPRMGQGMGPGGLQSTGMQQHQPNMGGPRIMGQALGQGGIQSAGGGMQQPYPGMQQRMGQSMGQGGIQSGGGLLGAGVQSTGQPMAPQPNLNNGANNGKRQIPGYQPPPNSRGWQAGANGPSLRERILANKGQAAPLSESMKTWLTRTGQDVAQVQQQREQTAMDRYNRLNNRVNPPTQQNQMQAMQQQMQQSQQQQMQQYQQQAPQQPQAPQAPQQPAWAGMPGFGFGGGGSHYPSQGQVGFRPGG